ncbi:unnamed protein product [Brassicogethes aeneus]|nr:unnamed protein product [Brassicogethes aeneus]
MQVAQQQTMTMAMGYPANMMASNQAPTVPWQYKIPKEEPMDDRDDSGINSGISSPGSDSSHDIMNPFSPPIPTTVSAMNGQYSPCLPNATQTYPINIPRSTNMYHQVPNSAQNSYYSTPVQQVKSYPTNLLTPPISEPSRDHKEESENEVDVNEDALRHLQRAFGQSTYNPGQVSKSSEDESKSEDDKPKVAKFGGKRKMVKCKHCPETFSSKEDMWDHYRVHIKSEKLLACPHCPFVTEYKHHFEYHSRNHTGSKPYKCEECSYECVSKSMLNSHMKSHSNIYQYHCRDCNYVAKYCHSLKQHLRKYNHRPGAVLNPDGSPNPFPIIDVYGTRRGPKIKKVSSQGAAPKEQQQVPPLMNHLMMNPAQMNFPMLPQLQEQMQQFFHPLLGALSQQMMLQNLERLARGRQLSTSTDEQEENLSSSVEDSQSSTIVRQEDNEESERHSPVSMKNEEDVMSEASESGALDLSKAGPSKSRRKGPAFRLSSTNETSDDDDDHLTTMFSNVEVVQQNAEETDAKESPASTTECQYCNIDFRDNLLYSLHMRYHSPADPFTCSICSEHHPDKLRFYLHINQRPH